MIFIIFTLTFCVLYCFNIWMNYKKFYSQGLKGPFPLPFIGNILKIRSRPFSNYEAENFKKYGDTWVDFVLGSNGIIVTSNPQYIKKILIKDFQNFSYRLQPYFLIPYAGKAVIFQNEDWKRIRSQITPVFSTSKLRLMFKRFDTPIQTCFDNIDKLIDLKQNEKIDMKKLMRSFALDMIGCVVFSLQTNTFKDDDFSRRVMSIFTNRGVLSFLSSKLPKFLVRLFQISSFDKEGIDYFVKLSKTLIEERKKNKQVYNDFIELLLKSESDSEIKGNFDEEGHIIRKLTTEEIIGQTFVFFIAGLETIGTSLSALMYELAINQNIQDKLYQELKECYPNDDISYDDISKSKYLDCVISETLRKHTTVNRIFRIALSDYDFGDFKVQKGQIMAVCLFNLHNDPTIYKDPHKFIPERFENNDIVNKYPDGIVYAPFNDGPRNCIGNRFAIVEMKLLVIKLIRKYRVFATGTTEIPLKIKNSSIVISLKDLNLGVERRTS